MASYAFSVLNADCPGARFDDLNATAALGWSTGHRPRPLLAVMFRPALVYVRDPCYTGVALSRSRVARGIVCVSCNITNHAPKHSQLAAI